MFSDTQPETSSNTIYFRTSGDLKGIIDPDGVLIFTRGTYDPITITPSTSKVASFQGDIDVLSGIQFTQTNLTPPTTNIPNKATLYVSPVSIGTFNNTLVFVDKANVTHLLGDVISSTTSNDNSIVRYDGITGKIIQNSSVTLDDNNKILGLKEIESNENIILKTTGLYSTIIDGNLIVNGTTSSVDSEVVIVNDNILYLNNGYTSPVGKEGGLSINYLPTNNIGYVDVGGFISGIPSVSNPVVYKNGFTFVTGDIIQISSAFSTSNNGLFEVLSDTGSVLTIKGIGLTPTTQSFFQNQFVTDTTVSGVITQINIFCLGVSSGGVLITQKGNNSSDTNIVTPMVVVSSLTSAGGTASLVSDGVGPELSVKGLTAGTGISLTVNANDIVITNTGATSSSSYMSAYDGGGGTTFSIGTIIPLSTWQSGQMSAEWSKVNVSGFDRFVYSGTSGKRFLLNGTLTLASTANGTTSFMCGLTVNGGGVSSSIGTVVNTAANYDSVVSSIVVTLNSGDYLSMYMSCVNGTGTFPKYVGSQNSNMTAVEIK